MAYESAMLQRPARSIFAKAGEIDATRTCFEELALNAKAYPDNLLEHLLRFENPLETVREPTPCGAFVNMDPNRRTPPP